MGRNKLSSPIEKDTPVGPSEKTPSAGGLESFQQARPFLAAEMTLILFLLDNSASMAGEPIECLQKGFRLFLDALGKHPRASKAVEVALISVSGKQPTLLSPFQPATAVVEPKLEAGGGTPLNGGFLMALDEVDRKRAANVAKGIDCRTPLILAVTDGEATDEDLKEKAKAAIATVERAKPPRVEVHGLAVNANALGELEEVLCRKPVLVSRFSFEEIMRKLSQAVIARSVGGTADILHPLQEPLPRSAREETRDATE